MDAVLSMNQRFHVVMQKGRTVIRTPLPHGKKYNSGKFIHPVHEVRQFLEPLGEFAMASIADPIRATELIDSEFINSDDKRKWYVAGGFIRDDGSVFVLLPERITTAEFFKRLGLRVDLPKWADSFKVGKYLKRLWSHHRVYVQGDVIEENNQTIRVKLDNGKLLSIRYAPRSPLTEGMNLVSKHCLEMFGIPMDNGTGLRVTALSTRGFTKGHAIVLEGLKYDLVMYETKELLTSNGRFTFALDELHPGKLYTDAQSVVNFQLYDGDFMEKWAEMFMRQVIANTEDEEKLRRMLRFYNVGFHKPTFHPGETPEEGEIETRGTYIDKEKDWGLLRAMRAGLPITRIPAMLRKVFHLFFDQVMDCEDKQRIPVQPEVGGARYILVDPTIFDVWGDPSLEGELRGNQVYVPGHNGQVVFHRQPNAHRGEHHIAICVQKEELIKMDTGCFMFISRDVVAPVLKKLGGGDQDDRVCFYKDPKVVEHFAMLPAYPLKETIKKAIPELPLNRFANKLRKPTYDLHQLKVILAQQQQQRVSIGQAVNPIIMDTLISDQQTQIINYLSEIREKDVRINAALAEMRKFSGFKMNAVASQLESIIDAVKRDGADVTAVSKEIRNFWTWLPVVPRCFLHGGEFDGRLPQSRRGDALPVIVNTHLDTIIDGIRQVRVELEEFMTMRSWEVVEDVSMYVLTFPDAPGDVHLARAIRSEYHRLREKFMTPVANDDSKARVQAFLEVDHRLYDKFKDHPLIINGMIKLYQLIYSRRAAEAPRDENGNAKPYPDGILWGPYMGGLTMKALDITGMTGRYEEVEFYRGSRRYKHGTFDVWIDQEGLVSITPDNQIGMVDPIASGQVKMESGFVRVSLPVEATEPFEVFTVVAGLASRGATPEEVVAWKSHVHEEVELRPGTWLNPATNEEDHAVFVYLSDGTKFGSISAAECHKITNTISGWLAPAKDPHSKTLTVFVKGGIER